MMHFKAYILLIVLLMLQQRLRGQNDLYKFRHLDVTSGLSDNQVNCIFKDDKGFMWFGTTFGLNRYDGYKFKIFKRDVKNVNSLGENHVTHIDEGPEHKLWIFTHSEISIYNATTEGFSNNIDDALARYHIHTSQIKAIKKDREKNYWFITNNKGLYCYHPQTGATVFYSHSGGPGAILHSNAVTDIVGNMQNSLWIIYGDGMIEQLDTRTNKIVFNYAGIVQAVNNKPQDFNMMMDNKNNLWVYSSANPIGAYCYHAQGNLLRHYGKETSEGRLNSNIINSIVQADDDKIWIGTDHGGINVVDPATLQVTYVVSKEDDSKSLSGNSVVLYKDDTGIIWAGTFKQGINYFHSGIMQFPLFRHFATDKKSLPFEDVNCYAEDAAGNLWIGTNGGGLIYFNRTTGSYTQYKHDPLRVNSLSNDVVIRLCIDHDHKLWIGTYFGGLDCYDGATFTNYRHNDKISGSLSDDRVYSVMEDADHHLWAGTFAGNLNVFNPAHHAFTHPRFSGSTGYTSVLYQDKKQNIWIGRDNGIYVVEKATNSVRRYAYHPQNINGLIANDINTILEDSRSLVWIGTKDGLSILNTKTNKFLNAGDGFNFPSTNVSNILEDNDGQVWISTNEGLASVRLSQTGGKYNMQVNNYDESDGLQGREFNLNSSFKLRSGEIIFGGAHGFNLFNPRMANAFKPGTRLVITDFQLFNKSVAVGEEVKGSVVLKKSISETQALELKHDQNVFSIEFVASDYFNPDKISYQYTLENFDKGWITSPGDIRKATYTNLDGGDYIFKVRAQDTNNPASVSVTTLRITVLPPFWKTPLAYVAYLLAGLGMLFYIRHRGIIKLKRQFELKQEKMAAERKIEYEREEARRMHHLDLMKIKFFTNISHEFRTPLSLILSPIDDLIKLVDKPDQQSHLIMIKRNGKRLLNLVNQLLDFRKMEYNELTLCLKTGDIIQFIREVSASFSDVAQQKQIQLLFESDECSYTTNFDHDKIERVLFNLLSNALKFTPSGGHISVMVSLPDTDEPSDDQKMLEIKVIDTGIGVSKENHEKIFDRFFQDNIPEGLLNQGSGIGLAITKELIRMHGGTINIESEPDYGTCFIINLPVGGKLNDRPATPLQEEKPLPSNLKNTDDSPGSAKKPTILLVEDDDDLRFYLKDNLKNSFHIIEAINGKDGWQKALAMHPKLIVSDVTMPVMNGLELCKKLKADSRTIQIPVILLTALTREADQLAGLGNGANDYIVKPFNFEILLSKIHNLLLMQQNFKDTFQRQIDVQARDIMVESEDEKFLKNAFEYIEGNITNPNFSVEELSRHLNLSRVSLYKKLLTLTGKTPVDCIRTVRLKRAVQLLEKSKLSIANVAYEVGFNNAAYFAKVFREEFGMLPSEYISELKNKEKEELLT